MKKMLAMAMALLLMLGLTACKDGAAKGDAKGDNLASQETMMANPKVVDDTMASAGMTESTPNAAADFIGDHFVATEYQYTMYGQLAGMEEMDDDWWVVAIMALDWNGDPYEGYDTWTYYLSKDLLPEEPIPFQDHVYRFEVVNDDRGGGSISLPSMVLELEEISMGDIPMWGGL